MQSMELWNQLDRLDSKAISDRLEPGLVLHPASREHPRLAYDEPKPAAVLLPMFRHLGAWHLLFIRRTEHEGDHHSGQVAFPGGGTEPGDTDAVATALREAQEEVGLEPNQVVLLGEMRPMHTVSNFLVTPVVGEIPWPLELTPDPVEVARVFSIPLAWLADPANRRTLTYPSADHPDARDVVFYDELDGEVLWGVSARITVEFLAVLSGR
jgi:8-oxo-dGTP pyrophosphatase MutT (NUDIX family)